MKNEESGSEEEGEKFAKHTHKKHQDLFQKNPVNMDFYGDYDDEDEDDESDADSDDQHQENVFNQQNAFGMQVFA